MKLKPILILIVIVGIVAFFFLPGDNAWENDALTGNIILTAIYSFHSTESQLPDSLEPLFPKYLDFKPNTDRVEGWMYDKWDVKDTVNAPYIFKLSRYTSGYKTRIQYFHEKDRAYWIINSEGTRYTVSVNPPDEASKWFPNGNLGTPDLSRYK